MNAVKLIPSIGKLPEADFTPTRHNNCMISSSLVITL